MFFKNEKINIYIVSIIWGVGIATFFRKICDDNKCLVIKAPSDMVKYEQQIGNQCYRFERQNINCEHFLQ